MQDLYEIVKKTIELVKRADCNKLDKRQWAINLTRDNVKEFTKYKHNPLLITKQNQDEKVPRDRKGLGLWLTLGWHSP